MKLFDGLKNWSSFQRQGAAILISLFMVCAHYSCEARTHEFKIIKTTCEYQLNPTLVATTTPRFGWQVQTGKESQGTLQSAYTIEIYDQSGGKEVKIWDSGKVASTESQQIPYNGAEELIPGMEYTWRVKVWDSHDVPSPWGEYATFRMAPTDLAATAKWIGAIDIKDANIPEGRSYHGLSISSEAGQRWQQTHPLSKQSIYLRKEVPVNKKVKSAIIYISGLGHYELTLNGEKLGNAQFDPMWSDYDKTIYYNAYDVTNQLEKNNAIGVLLGNGFFNQQGGRYVKMQVSFGPPTLLFKMHLTYNDGTVEEINSNDSWKYSFSPLVYNDMYGGEDYDARLEQEGWDTPGFDDSKWQPVVLQTAPKGQLKPQTTDPIKVMETYTAPSIRKVDDAYVFDMGQNLSGFPRIKVQGKEGDVIRLTVGENIYEDGSVNQSQSGSPYYYEYILKGGEEEVWHPRFTYYGYRYIQVNGAKPERVGDMIDPVSPTDDPRDIPIIKEIESCFVYNSSARTGHFNSSNELFNDAYRLIINAIKSNMHAVFTDCPHREKLGWLEQVHLNGPGLFYNFDLTTFAPKIMQDIRDAQLPNGLVPDIAPEYVVFEGGFRDSPEWGSTSVILPFMYYQFYGDNSLIVEYYDVMKGYVDYLSSTATNHIVSHGLGDWCDYREDQPYGVSHNTPVPLSASTHYFMVVDYLVQAAEMTGNKEDHARYAALKEEVKAAFNKEFFNEQTRQYGTGSQASNAMPLFAGIVEPEHKEAVLENLVKEIEEKGYRLSTGDVGNRYLFQTLADNGLNEVMYKMHNHREVPGYGFQLQFGATTLTELWDPRAGASWNHFMMGQILEWFYKSLAGIRMEHESINIESITNDGHANNYQTVTIAPQVVGDLTYVSASHETVSGTISVDWRVEEGHFIMDLSVPFNCQAKVYLPGEENYELVQSGTYSFRNELFR
mgnify:CR=1 FL=1